MATNKREIPDIDESLLLSSIKEKEVPKEQPKPAQIQVENPVCADPLRQVEVDP